MINKLLSLFQRQAPVEAPPQQVPSPKPKTPRKKKVSVPPAAKELTPKELATSKNEPYIEIVSMELDPANIHEGAFEFDWNDIFIAKLVRAGYKMKDSDTDNTIVDRWFQVVCRNIVLELYEQDQADPENRDVHERVINTRPLGSGRTEVS